MDVSVRFFPSGKTTEVAAGTILMEAVKAVGLPIAEACGAEGFCGRCGLRVTGAVRALSEETEAESLAKSRNRIDSSLRLACFAKVVEDVEVTADYW